MAAATRRSRKASDPPPCTPAGDNDDLRARIREASLKLKNALSCPVCHDWFEDPIALGCGHALHVRCTAELIRLSPAGARCPLCREPLVCAGGWQRGRTRRDAVANFFA